MPMSDAALHELEDLLGVIKRVVWKRLKKQGRKFAVLAQALRKAAGSADELFDLFATLGAHLGKRLEGTHLKVGVHGSLTTELSKVNNAVASWQVAFTNILEGKRLTRNETAEIMQRLSSTILESHHPVEVRLLNAYPQGKVATTLRATYGATADEARDKMVGIAIFADSHRGASYLPLGEGAALKDILKASPPSAYNLTPELIKKFSPEWLKANDPPMDEFLVELAKFYKGQFADQKLSGHYPKFLEALKLVAADTKTVVTKWP
jgi:hypothetical protein